MQSKPEYRSHEGVCVPSNGSISALTHGARGTGSCALPKETQFDWNIESAQTLSFLFNKKTS